MPINKVSPHLTAIVFLAVMALPFSIFSQAGKLQYKLGEKKVFIKNYGQFSDKIKNVNPSVEYAAEYNGAQIYFTRAGITYRYDKYIFETEIEKEENPGKEEKKEPKLKTFSFSLEWIGSNPDAQILAQDVVPEYFLYPAGDQKTNIRAEGFKKITYKNLYPNVDVEYTIHEKGGLKYSLFLKPGADPSKIKFRYKNDSKSFLDDAGNLHVVTDKGDLIDHAPTLSYRNDGQFVKTNFTISKGVVGINIENYDSSQLLVIDPWTVNPGLPGTNRGYDVARDAAGNIYVLGGSAGNYELRKFTSTGGLLWTYNASTTIGFYYGDFAVDYSTNIYISSGCCTGLIVKLDPAGNVKWTHPYNTQFYEVWRLAFDCNYNYLIAGGGPYNYSVNQYQIASIDTATGNFVNPDSVGMKSELRSIAIDPVGSTYGLYVSPAGAPSTTTNYMIATTGPLFNQTYNVGSNYTMDEQFNTQYTGTSGFAGFNGIAINGSYAYTTDGSRLYKRDLTNGAQLATVVLPGGSQDFNSGIMLDGCGNVYAGSGNGIYKFDPNLALITSVTTPIVYDLCMGDNNEIIASGDGFLGSYALNACQPKLIMNPSSTPSCGGQTNGTASVSVTGGTGPYTYSWKPVGGTTSSISNLAPGTYTVIITDVNGCNGGINDTTVVVGTLGSCGVLSATGTSTDIKCKGQNNGTALASPVGGTGPFTYIWSYGPTTQTLNNLPSGTYTVTITDATPNNATATVTITEPGSSVSASAVQNMGASCGSNNGIAVATANGGTGTLTYTWSSGGISATENNLAAGNYTVTVKDVNACTQTATVAISSAGGPTITSVIPTNGTCTGTPGSAIANASGGSGVLVYSWSSGAFTQTASNLASGTYTVTVTDGNACTATSTTTINNGAAPNITSATPTNPLCFGQTNGSVNINASGGTGALTYSWSSGGNAATENNLGANTYTVTVTDNAGCKTTSTVTLVDPVQLSITTTAITPDVCSTNSGTASVSASGGTGTLTYSWNSGPANATANNLSANTYTVTVTDNKGCKVTSSTTVSAVGFITASANPDSAICTGQTIQLSASGGTNYSWAPPATLSNAGIPNPIASPTSNTNYTVTVQRGTCSDTDVVVITVNPLPVASAGMDTTIMNGESIQLGASGGISFTWTPGSSLDDPNIFNPTASPTSTTTYTLMVTDANGCTNFDYLTIFVTEPPPCTEKDVEIPTAFSPNNDGQNDVLFVRGSNYCIKEFLFEVFNRWGEKVFESTDLTSGWDGNFRNKNCDTGVFMWTINVVFPKGNKLTKHGNVTLIR